MNNFTTSLVVGETEFININLKDIHSKLISVCRSFLFICPTFNYHSELQNCSINITAFYGFRIKKNVYLLNTKMLTNKEKINGHQ